MAFLARADIASSLPSGFDTALVDRLLVRLGVELKGLGLVWDNPSSTTRPVKGEQNSYNSILDFNFVKTISAVNLKYEGSTSSCLLSASQYNLVEHPNLDTYFYRIELNGWKLNTGEYLDITGLWGVFIDFTGTLDEKAGLLKGIIIDYILKQLRYSSQNYQTISRAKTGDTDIQFSQLEGSSYKSSILKDPEFSSALNYFKTLW
jgi:hypothetical protein